MSVGVIIVAAGRGQRMGHDTPKQLLDLGGRTMLQRSVGVFDGHPDVSEIVVVLPADLVDQGAALVGQTVRRCRFAAGGVRRQDSVRLGLAALPDGVDVVLVHDAARPFADRPLVDRVIAGARESGAVVPAVPASDTVKRVVRDRQVVAATIPREEIWLAQTPQGFSRRILQDAVSAGTSDAEATDEAALAERTGVAVHVVMGDRHNVKITTHDDLEAARARFDAAPRVGTGFDLHRLTDRRPLVLAGETLSRDRGPVSHSDGDVLCHALTDAVLGAAGAGDIGRHFPDSDPQWAGAAGLDLLARAVAIVESHGWRVSSVDATVILERPKLAPHVDAMRARLAAALGVPADRIGLKAKTHEGVDAVGRGEAIAAQAVAVLVRGSAP